MIGTGAKTTQVTISWISWPDIAGSFRDGKQVIAHMLHHPGKRSTWRPDALCGHGMHQDGRRYSSEKDYIPLDDDVQPMPGRRSISFGISDGIPLPQTYFIGAAYTYWHPFAGGGYKLYLHARAYLAHGQRMAA
jgi:hypothetical protein